MEHQALRKRYIYGIPLGLALLARATGLGFSLPYLAGEHDERFIVETAVGMLGGDLEPQTFRFPNLFIYLIVLAYQPLVWWFRWTGRAETFPELLAQFDLDVSPFFLVARSLSLIAALATVALLVLFTRRLAGWRAGLIAGIALALNPLHIELFRSARVDATLVLFITACLFFAHGFVESRRRGDMWLMALSAGAAFATKFSGPFLLAPMMAACWIGREQRKRPGGSRAPLVSLVAPTLVVVLVPIAIFLLVNPWYIAKHRELLGWFAHLSGEIGVAETARRPPSHLYYGRLFLTNSLGVGLVIAAVVGFVTMVRKHRRSAIIMLSLVVPYLLVFGTSRPAFERYLVPVVAVCCIAVGVASGANASRRWLWPVLVVAFAPTMYFTASRALVGARNADTRVMAAEWIEANVPAGSGVVILNDRGDPVALFDRREKAFASRMWLRGQLREHADALREARSIRTEMAEGARRPAYQVITFSREAFRPENPGGRWVVVCGAGPDAGGLPPMLQSLTVAIEYRPGWFVDGPDVIILAPSHPGAADRTQRGEPRTPPQ